MEQLLIRGGANPNRRYSPGEILRRDSLGGNSGNLMFLYGTMNVLTTSNVKCFPTYYKSNWTAREIDEINQSFSAFVRPLADAFRFGFIENLDRLTNLISKLKIPCIVNGVGLRASYEPDPDFSYPFNDTVKNFVKEVLDHSAVLGVRGEITGDYLKKLGFRPENDFSVIGCPSIYMYGRLHENCFPKTNRIAVSLNGLASKQSEKLYTKLITSNENTHIIQQRTSELIDLYYKRNLDLSTKAPEFDRNNIFDSFGFI